MRTLKDNPDTGLRHSIYIALGNIGSAEAWDTLIKGLNEEGWFVRRSALQALGKIDAPRSVPYLLQALEDEHPGVRREAVFIILKYKLPEAKEGLKKALEDEDFETRFYARQALKILEEGA